MAWGRATTAFALLQAAGAWGLSRLFITTGDYRPLFAVGAAVLLPALAIDVVTRWTRGAEVADGES